MRNDAIGSVESGFAEAVRTSAGRNKNGDSIAQFRDLLRDRIGQVNDLQGEADQRVRDLVTGRTDNVHEVLVAVNEADLSFRLMMEVRNKLVEAYREVMRMQV